MDVTTEAGKTPLFGSFPKDGIWTSVGMTRAQFLAAIAVSTALFIFIDGPLWRHLHASHFARIVWSYAAIPPVVAGMLYLNGKARIGMIVAASVVVGLVKLVLTAAIVVLIGLARM